MASVNHFFIVVLLPLGSIYSTIEFEDSTTLYQNGTKQDYIQLDGTSAYMTGGLFGQTLVLRKVNWDYESNQPRYKVMDERFAMVVGFYPLPVKSALKPHLEYVQAALWEAGILNLWYERNLDRMARDLDWQVSQKGNSTARLSRPA
ncbi:hypothetical protein quinque_006934 [Culex quinquefasciatus]